MVYVDEVFEAPPGSVAISARKHGTRWCHLWADYEDQAALHQIAASIGMKRSWFQKEGTYFPHYDLVPSKRDAAIRAGAQPMALRDWMAANRERIQQFARRGEHDSGL